MYEEGHGARGICAMRMEKLEHMEGSGEFRTGWSVDSFIYIYVYIHICIYTYICTNMETIGTECGPFDWK